MLTDILYEKLKIAIAHKLVSRLLLIDIITYWCVSFNHFSDHLLWEAAVTLRHP